jgi:hypothetical chaperone protein
MTATACGLDFGTSNSTLGVGGRLVALEGAAVTLPSAVFWEADGGAPRFGRAAIAAYLEGEDGRLLRGLKSTLGSGLVQERTRVGARSVSFREVLARFIGHMKTRAETVLGGPLTQVVMGRPVHFVDDDPQADKAAEQVLADIARDLGFAEVTFQYEPIAAALDYETTVSAEELVLIVDIGGGTSDFSILRVGPDRARLADRAADILANDGIRLGGTDFDRQFSLTEVMPDLGYLAPTMGGQGVMPRHYYLDLATWHRINKLYADRVMADMKALRRQIDAPELLDRMIRVLEGRHGHALAIEVERAKIALSHDDATRLMLRALTGGANPVVTRARLEAALAGAMDRVAQRIAQVLAMAGTPADRIGTVFLTGGSSALPALRAAVAQAVPGARLARGDDLASVGTGLAVVAARRFG